MTVEVASWNIRDSFSDEVRGAEVLQWLETSKPDVAVFPEAYREGYTESLAEFSGQMRDMGYRVTACDYDDNDGRADRHGLVVIGKPELEVQPAQPLRLAGRTAIKATVADPATDEVAEILGVHLSDRPKSARSAQAVALLRQIGASEMAVVGDINNLPRDAIVSRVLRSLRSVVDHLPSQDPDPDVKPPKLARLGSVMTRLVEMAEGDVLQLLVDQGFESADGRHRPTAPSRLPLIQLDHVLTTSRVVAAPSSFRVHPRHKASDHRAISAALAVFGS